MIWRLIQDGNARSAIRILSATFRVVDDGGKLHLFFSCGSCILSLLRFCKGDVRMEKTREGRILDIFIATARHLGVGAGIPLFNGSDPVPFDLLVSSSGLLPALVLEGDVLCRKSFGLSLAPALTRSDAPLAVSVKSFGVAPAAVILACLTKVLRDLCRPTENGMAYDVSPLIRRWEEPCRIATQQQRDDQRPSPEEPCL